MHKLRVKTQPGLGSCAACKRHSYAEPIGSASCWSTSTVKQDSFELKYPLSSIKQCASSKRLCTPWQGVPKTGRLTKLASESRQARAVSKALFAVLSLGLALQCSLVTRSGKTSSYQLRKNCQGLALLFPRNCASSFCREQRLPQNLNEL